MAICGVVSEIVYLDPVTIGDRIDETGLLLREGGGFQLRRDAGGRYTLVLQRVPVDEVQKQVRVIGYYAGGDLVEVEGIQRVGRATPQTD